MSLTEIRVSVRANRFSIYSHYYGDRNTSGIYSLQGNQARLRQNGLSKKAGRNLKDAVDTLLTFASWKTVFVKESNTHFRYKVNFITLTLPSLQIHSDEEIVSKVLSPFLKAWSRRTKNLLYIWKAEIQDNGNIHFHITSNKFYHWRKLRTHWNNFVNRLNYVDNSTSNDPNSTDVHSVKNIKNLSAYLSSYLLKKDNYSRVLTRYLTKHKKQLIKNDRPYTKLPKNYFNHIKRKVTSAIWNCSLILKRCKLNLDYYDIECNPEFESLFNISTNYNIWYSEHATTVYDWMHHYKEFRQLGIKYFNEFERLILMENANSKEVVSIDNI